MARPRDEAQELGTRVGALLDEFDGHEFDVAQALVQALAGFYEQALTRVVGNLDDETVLRLSEDPLIAAVLVLHDLHPVDVETRVAAALDGVRPMIGSHAGGVTLLGVADGVARLRLEGGAHGCRSSLLTVRNAIETAILEAAPEVEVVDIESAAAPEKELPLLQIQTMPCPVSA
jgi:Fe-S cluster biogenesis protein NfuA